MNFKASGGPIEHGLFYVYAEPSILSVPICRTAASIENMASISEVEKFIFLKLDITSPNNLTSSIVST
jgi:hypothetical protein